MNNNLKVHKNGTSKLPKFRNSGHLKNSGGLRPPSELCPFNKFLVDLEVIYFLNVLNGGLPNKLSFRET